MDRGPKWALQNVVSSVFLRHHGTVHYFDAGRWHRDVSDGLDLALCSRCGKHHDESY